MLILLLSTFKQEQVALGAAANALDTDLTSDLDALIQRTERELVALSETIDALPVEYAALGSQNDRKPIRDSNMPANRRFTSPTVSPGYAPTARNGRE